MVGRGPKLLPTRDLPDGFDYPAAFLEVLPTARPRHWEWLTGSRLRKAAERFWQVHPPTLVPFALRRGTSFVACFDAEGEHADGIDVVTLDATTAEMAPVQHTPSFTEWYAGLLAEEQAPPREPAAQPPVESAESPADPPAESAEESPRESSAPEPEQSPADDDPAPALPGSWEPPERGRCACKWHLDEIATERVPFGRDAQAGDRPLPLVSDLVMDGAIAAVPDYPGPRVEWRGRPLGPFHWRVRLGGAGRPHLDRKGRGSLEEWLMWNPGVGLVVWPEREDLHLMAPGLCRDGVVTLVARALLDDRVRRR